MGAALLAVGLELLIGIVIGLIVTVIGLFLGNIKMCIRDRSLWGRIFLKA